MFSNLATLSECLVEGVHSTLCLIPRDAGRLFFATVVTHEMIPRVSNIFAESDNTSRLVISDSSMDNSVEENRKWS